MPKLEDVAYYTVLGLIVLVCLYLLYIIISYMIYGRGSTTVIIITSQGPVEVPADSPEAEAAAASFFAMSFNSLEYSTPLTVIVLSFEN